MWVLSTEILLLQRVVFGLDSLMSLFLHGRGSFSFSTGLSRPLTSYLLLCWAALSSHLQVIQLLVEHHRLLNDGKIKSLTFLCLEVLQSLLLKQTLSKVSLSRCLLLFTLTIVSNIHEMLRTLPLRINLAQDPLLVPLQNTEARLKRLEHTWVLILDALSEY